MHPQFTLADLRVIVEVPGWPIELGFAGVDRIGCHGQPSSL